VCVVAKHVEWEPFLTEIWVTIWGTNQAYGFRTGHWPLARGSGSDQSITRLYVLLSLVLKSLNHLSGDSLAEGDDTFSSCK